MILDYPTGVLLLTNKGGDFLSDKPRICPCCHRSTYWLRNENGKTACVSCADEKK